MTPVLLEAAPVTNWHRLDVRSWGALARSRVRLIGALDMDAVDEIDRAVLTAEVQEHSLVLDLGQVSSVTPEAMHELLNRGHQPRFSLAR